MKDVMSPNGAVSIVMEEKTGSADINSHRKTSWLRVHHAETGTDGELLREDAWLSMEGEPDHQGLCDREQDYLYRAITEDVDLTRHMSDAVASLGICSAADESIRAGQRVML